MAKNKKLKLFAETAEDLKVISTMCQDAVGVKSKLRWHKKDKMFSLIINRVMWEALDDISGERIHPERVQSIICFRWVISVKSRGFNLEERDNHFSLLSINYDNLKGSNHIRLIFSGNLEIFLQVEYLEAFLQDIGEAYPSITEKLPRHEI